MREMMLAAIVVQKSQVSQSRAIIWRVRSLLGENI
jgi:hypothetical protein